MKKLLFPLLILAFFFFKVNTVYAGIVTYPTETNILLTTPNITLAVEANSSADSVTVSDSNITVTVSAPDSFVLRSDNKYNLANNGSFGISCGTTSKLTIQPSSGTQTIIVTPTTATCTVSTLTSSTSSNNSATAPSCGDTPPGAKAPWLYAAIPQDGNSVLLYFTDADDPVNKYVLQFGLKSGNYPWGSTNIGGKGMRIYLVQMLLPNTTYYFRVRGGNGCATGIWSNEISAKTKSLVSFNQLGITNSSLETIPAESSLVGEKKQTQQGYDVKVKVIDANKKPVEGATVTLHSNPQTTKTDKSGIALFHNIEQGEHKVLIAYNNYQSEQSVNLTGDVKEFDLNIQVKPQSVFLNPQVIGVIGALAVTISVMGVMLLKARHKLHD